MKPRRRIFRPHLFLMTFLIGMDAVLLFFLFSKRQQAPQVQSEMNVIPVEFVDPSPTASASATPLATKAPRVLRVTPPPDTEPWGVAKQLDEVTWRMKVGEDDRIGTPREIHEAINVYRKANGQPIVTWDDNLASFATERAKYLNNIRTTDKHVGFQEYAKKEENLKKLGFWMVGENISYGYRLSGVHLIEWIFAGDEPHDKNQLNSTWSHVGVGVDGLGVAIIFGGWKI